MNIIQGFIVLVLILLPFGLLVEKIIHFSVDNRKGTR